MLFKACVLTGCSITIQNFYVDDKIEIPGKLMKREKSVLVSSAVNTVSHKLNIIGSPLENLTNKFRSENCSSTDRAEPKLNMS